MSDLFGSLELSLGFVIRALDGREINGKDGIKFVWSQSCGLEYRFEGVVKGADVAQKFCAEIIMLGGFEVRLPNSAVVPIKNRKARALLARVVLANGAPVERSWIIDQLWQDRGKQQALGSLRQCLRELRLQLGGVEAEILRIDRERVALVPSAIRCDLFERDGQLPADYRGELLRGLDPIAPVFDEWLSQERRAIAERQIRLCEEHLNAADTLELKARYAESLLKFDACHEAAARAGMEAYAELNQASNVARIYSDLTDSMRSHGFSVSPETRNCFESLRHVSMGHAGLNSNSSVVVKVPAVAIGPIPTRGIAAEGHSISDLFTEELMGHLTQMPELQVSFIQDMLIDVEIGNKQNDIILRMGVQYILRGSLSVVSERIRFTFSLTHAETATSIWSGQEEISYADVFGEVKNVAERACTSILPAIERFEVRERRTVDDKHLLPYDHYLRAKQLFLRPGSEAYLEEAEKHLEQAISLAPDFSPAYVILIQSLNTGRIFTKPGTDLDDSRERALELSEKLLNLDSRNPNAQIAWAWCMLWKGEFEIAEKSIRTAISLNPYEASRLNAIGTALLYLGYPDEAFAFYEKTEAAMSNDLDYLRTDYGELYYFAGDFSRSRSFLSVGDKRTEMRTRFWRSVTLAQCGDLALARLEAETFVSEVKKRWVGPSSFKSVDAVKWMLRVLPLRRRIDQDLVESGINKLGFM